MEAAGQIFSTRNFGVFKEPRGIIKPIQWILSIFAFATTTSVTLMMRFHANCPQGNSTVTTVRKYELSSSYPFSLEDESVSGVMCNSTRPVNQHLLQGSQSAAQFYVFVGVMVFLYCMAALIMYIFCDDFYRKHTKCTIGDFIVSCVLVILWLISSSAWAQGVSDLKYYTDLSRCGYFNHIPDCANGVCQQDMLPNFASLNVSIIFGFLNMCVWVGNLWFLYKETPWHKVTSKPPTLPGQSPDQTDPQRI